jgi:hypothetical protein
LYNVTTGYYNIAIGDSAGINITTGSNNIAIGSFSSVPDGTASNQVVIGNSSTTANYFTGKAYFTDTLNATTMGITDSSNRVASTAWVKNQRYVVGTFLSRKLTTIQRLAFRAEEGDLVWDLTLHKLFAWDGTDWKAAW